MSKFCADCKYLVGVRYKKYEPESVSKWNCGHMNNSRLEEPNLITGIQKPIFRFSITELRYLNTIEAAKAQLVVCGREGKWYEKYEEPQHKLMQTDILENNSTPNFTKPKPLSSSALKSLTKKLDLGMDPE